MSPAGTGRATVRAVMILARPWIRAWLWPVAAWLLVRVALWASALAVGHDALRAKTWIHWDAWLYLLQAKDGATLVACTRSTGYAPTEWCGTAGWMPLYPMAIRALTQVGVAPELAAASLSGAAAIAVLMLVGRALRDVSAGRAFAALLLAAFWPGAVYFHAGFPISLMHVCVLVALQTAIAGRWTLAGLSGGAGAAMYSTGFLLAPVFAAEGLWSRRERRGAWTAAALVAAGLVAVLVHHAVATGRWDAFFLVQAKYGHGLTNPLGTWWWSVSQAWTETELHKRLSGAQTVLVTLLVLAAGWTAWRRRADAAVRLPALAAGAFWLFPLLMGPGVALFRAEGLTVPAALVLARAPWPVLAGATVAAAAFLPVMASQYFANLLR